MSKYVVTEGFIKEINVSGEEVTFTLEPVAPYLFEKKTDDGKIERMLLFVDSNSDAAKIKSSGQKFALPPSKCRCNLNTLLIAKANRMKVRIELDPDDSDLITILMMKVL